MLEHLLDTDFCVHVIRRRRPELLARLNAAQGRVAVSTITVTELVRGANVSAKPEVNRDIVHAFLSHTAVLPFDSAAAEEAGAILADLERRGCIIGPYDTLIAGHARSLGFCLVTGNRREFDRVPGLRCEDWAGPE